MTQDIEQQIIDLVSRRAKSPLKVRGLARELGITDDDYAEFRRIVRRLQSEGRLAVGRGRTVVLPESRRTSDSDVVGKYRRNPRGFGFVIPLKPGGEDIHISEDAALDAATGDTVRVRTVKRGKRDGKMLHGGRIVEVLERGQSRYVGQLRNLGAGWAVLTDADALHEPIHVSDRGAKGAREGDQVVVEIIRYPRAGVSAQGVIVELLGRAGDPGVDTVSIIRQFEIPDRFDARVLSAAHQCVDEYDHEQQAARREDLRSRTVITIDPADARDFDDALSLRVLPGGKLELGVHIADVAHFVPPRSAIDSEARRRGTSVYFPRHVVPMLPEVLSNGVCSLQEGEPRLTRSVFIQYDDAGNVLATRFANTVIQSTARLTYDQATLILDGKTGGFPRPVVNLVRKLADLARVIQKRRQAGRHAVAGDARGRAGYGRRRTCRRRCTKPTAASRTRSSRWRWSRRTRPSPGCSTNSACRPCGGFTLRLKPYRAPG